MKRRYIDPHADPLRAPSGAGHHPHVVPEGASKVNPQHMYERRNQMAQYHRMQARPVGQTPPPAPPQSDFWKMAGIFGLGALAVYLGLKAAQSEEPRQNPEPAPPPPQPAPAQLVVMPGPVPAMPVAAPQAPPAVVVRETKEVVKDVPQPAQLTSMAEILQPAKAKAKAKKSHPRKTSQARDEKGKYLPAGTRKRKIQEGKKEK